MNKVEILMILGCAFAFGTAIASFIALIQKIKARSRFVTLLSDSKAFREEARRVYHTETLAAAERRHRAELEKLRKIMFDEMKQLPKTERRRLEASLYQSSATGRERFIEKLAVDAIHLSA